MKTLIHKAGILATLVFFLLPNSLSAKKGGIEKTRNINKTYTVSNNHNIEIRNKFGEVKINSWEKNEVTLKVNIKVKDGNEKRVQSLLDRIQIDIKETSDKLSVKTVIDGGSKNLEIKTKGDGFLVIDYELNIPIGSLLDVKNSFGPLVLDKMDNNVKISLQFGGATIGDLNGDENDLSFGFADPVVISKMNGGKIDLKFSKLKITEAQNVELDSEMSSSNFDTLDKGDFNLKFGSIDVSSLNDLTLASQMSSVNIESLQRRAIIENKYGSLTIAKISQSIESIEVDAEFSPIKLTFEKGGSYQVDAHSKMAGLKLPSNRVQDDKEYEKKSSVVNNEKEFKGRIGDQANPSSIVKIQSSFGDVKLMLTD